MAKTLNLNLALVGSVISKKMFVLPNLDSHPYRLLTL